MPLFPYIITIHGSDGSSSPFLWKGACHLKRACGMWKWWAIQRANCMADTSGSKNHWGLNIQSVGPQFYTPEIYYTPWKMMLGRRLAFLLGPGLFSGSIYVKIPGCSWWVVTFNIFLPSRSRSFKTSPRSFSTSVADRIDFKFKSGLQRFEYGKIYSKKLFQNII